MLSVRPFAARIWALLLDPDELKPMFAPAVRNDTPWSPNRSRPFSPGHWSLRPQPSIIFWLCSAEARDRLLSSLSARRPSSARGALMCASTWAMMPPLVGGAVAGFGFGLGFGFGFGALVVAFGLGVA